MAQRCLAGIQIEVEVEMEMEVDDDYVDGSCFATYELSPIVAHPSGRT